MNNKVTVIQEEVDALLDASQTQEHVFWDGKEMLISYLLPSGFTITGRAAMLDPKYFDYEIGKYHARRDASRQLWQLEAYRKQLELLSTENKSTSA